MSRALTLAHRAKGKTSPNPIVGAVIARNGKIVGEGYHRRAGDSHAEIAALKDAGRASGGATLFVTLEPCCHHGRTGPCTEAVIGAGIKEVYAAMIDPNPDVNGRGLRRLRQAGVTVHLGLLRKEAAVANEAYVKWQTTGRPFVTLKLAQTLDGRIAARSGDSEWISSTASRKLVHRMRSESDAVLVGGGTVRSDNPSLTVRHIKGKNPYRIVLSSSLRFPRRCTLFEDNRDLKTIVATDEARAEQFARRKASRGLTLWGMEAGNGGRVHPDKILSTAASFGVQSLLVEGGAGVATSFLKAKAVDKMVIFTAPRIMGDGIDSVGDLGIRTVARSITFVSSTWDMVGEDSLFTGYPDWRQR